MSNRDHGILEGPQSLPRDPHRVSGMQAEIIGWDDPRAGQEHGALGKGLAPEQSSNAGSFPLLSQVPRRR